MNPLEQAVEKIEGGWCTGSLVNDGKVCAVGAIAAVELDVDMREIDRVKLEALFDAMEDDDEVSDRVKAARELEDAIYEQVDKLESAVALRDEIMESGWIDEHLMMIWPDDPTTRARVRESYMEQPTEAIVTFNDEQEDPAVVLEMFKHAAKRLDPKV